MTKREVQSGHGNHKQILTLCLGIFSLNYMFTSREMDGFDNFTLFIRANVITE